MKCLICHNKEFYTVHSYNTPDKYESWMGIKKIHRSWVRCINCGFYVQVRDYDIKVLENIYKNGYRDKSFRGESIDEAFDRIVNIKDSENESRYLWFAMNIDYDESKRVLDVGSGIGVWPHLLKRAEFDVSCVEENLASIDFIYEKLGISCYRGLNYLKDQFDVVTLLHVLEHIKKPAEFLKKIKTKLRKGGQLFIEVPDSVEFSYLDKSHDEFNSCHVAFYNMASLYRVLEIAGFTVVDMHQEKTKERNLSRVMALAIN